MRIIGLTGSIGMGKSTAAAMFRAQGVPVYDADAAVHRLYEDAAVPAVDAAFPGVAVGGRIDRARLADRVLGDAAALRRLEAIVHPLVRQAELAFLAQCRAKGYRLAVLEVPLLLESGGAERVDVVAVVTAAPDLQMQRVLARPAMTPEKLEALLARQMPDAEKRRRAHVLLDSSRELDAAARQIRSLLAALA